MLLLLLLLVVLFGGFGWYGGERWSPGNGSGIGLGTIVVIFLIIWLLGGFGGGLRFR